MSLSSHLAYNYSTAIIPILHDLKSQHSRCRLQHKFNTINRNALQRSSPDRLIPSSILFRQTSPCQFSTQRLAGTWLSSSFSAMSHVQTSFPPTTTNAASARNHINKTDGHSVAHCIVPLNCLAVTYSAINASLGGYCRPVLWTVVRFAVSTLSTLVGPRFHGTSSTSSPQHPLLASRASRSSPALAYRSLRSNMYLLFSGATCGPRGTPGARPMKATASWRSRRNSST